MLAGKLAPPPLGFLPLPRPRLLQALSHGVAGTKGGQTDPDEWGRLVDLEARALIERDAVDRALDRLRHGSFGLCVECGEPLSFLRLESRPWAALCEECDVAR